MKKFFPALIMFLLASSAMGQTYVGIGYQMGAFSSGLPNFQNQIYRWNRVVYPDFTDKFEYGNKLFGSAFEIGYLSDSKFYFFTGWNNSHYVTHGEGTYKDVNGNSHEGSIDVKVRHNVFHTIGFGYRLNKYVGFGASPLDWGNFKILYKDAKSTDVLEQDWTQLYKGNTGLLGQNNTFGGTVFLDVYPIKRIRLRASYYQDYFQAKLGLDPYYAFNINSFHLQASFIMGKLD